MKRNVILALILLAAVAGAFFAFLNSFLQIALNSYDVRFIQTILGGFAGAFFAFIFIRISEALNKYYDRQSRNHRALGKISYDLNCNISSIYGIIYLVDQFLNLEIPEDYNEKTVLYHGTFNIKEKPRDHLQDLINSEYLNKIYPYYLEEERTNNSLEVLFNAYEGYKKDILANRITPKEYYTTLKRIKSELQTQKSFLQSLLDSTYDLLSWVRVLLNHEPIFYAIIKAITPELKRVQLSREISTELELLKQDEVTPKNRIIYRERLSG